MTKRPANLEALLDYLKRTRGFDFAGYKRASLERRIQKRLQTVGASSYDDYLDYLEVHPEEFAGLCNTVLINVTSFFRDSETWDYVREVVVPELLSRRNGQPIRIWSAGCASGEEAYTLAMIFSEALGSEDFNERLKIYATDIDEEALTKARQALYTDREVAQVPPDALGKYFEASDGRFLFRKDLRRQVIFGRHDLMQDAPISRVDMLVCRNTLMYFNAETQSKILSRFQFALNDNGVLFLGRAETLMTHASDFAPLDLKRRISTKLPSRAGSLRERLLAAANGGNDNGGNAERGRARMRDLALDGIPSAQLLVDANGILTLANDRARSLFGISQADVLRPVQDLKISYQPVELRSTIDQVTTERRPVVLREIEWPSVTGDVRWLDVHVAPVIDPSDASLLGASISFSDVSTAKRLQRDLERANQALETAYEELQSTNEELETTNEELQSTIEELETTNEELQSTNEELETMNEELQSTNEELQTMNDEIRQRSDELNRVNAFLESILTSMRGAVVVVDNEIKVLVWNHAAVDLWGLRDDEVRGKNLLGLDIGLPTERLKAPIRSTLNGGKRHVAIWLEAMNRRGRHIICDITVAPLMTRAGAIHGAIILMEEHDGSQREPSRDGKWVATTARHDGKHDAGTAPRIGKPATKGRQNGKKSR